MKRIKSVLVIDDEPDVREVIAMTLDAMAGWSVVCAGNGWDGLRRAASEHPDVILLDVMMPEMDGLETRRALRAMPITANIPVIMMTAKARFRGEEVIIKPFDPSTLASCIVDIAGRFDADEDGSHLSPDATIEALWQRHQSMLCDRIDSVRSTLRVPCDMQNWHGHVRDDIHRLIAAADLFGLRDSSTLLRDVEADIDTDARATERLIHAIDAIGAEFTHESLAVART